MARDDHQGCGYLRGISFVNVVVPKGVNLVMGTDGSPLEPGNKYVPLISNLRFENVTGAGGCSLEGCRLANRSQCFNTSFAGGTPDKCTPPPAPGPPLPPQRFACKRTAVTMWGETLRLPWGVCLPRDAPVNNDPSYPNWGPATGDFADLAECKASCV